MPAKPKKQRYTLTPTSLRLTDSLDEALDLISTKLRITKAEAARECIRIGLKFLEVNNWNPYSSVVSAQEYMEILKRCAEYRPVPPEGVDSSR